ncbi:MAG: hypothetical protein AAF636_17435 [Pseudomonadota bacterium]
MNKYEALCSLKSVARSIERELGLQGLSDAEQCVLLVVQSLTKEPGDVIKSGDIRRHELVATFPSATFHRALRALVESNYLEKATGTKANSYLLSETQMDTNPK